MADISNYEEGINAWKCGVDIVGTTMGALLLIIHQKIEPDYELMERLAKDTKIFRLSEKGKDPLSDRRHKGTADRCMGNRGRRTSHVAGNRTEISEGN